MYKKGLLVVLLFLFAGTILAACGSNDDAGGADGNSDSSGGDLSGEITVWVAPFVPKDSKEEGEDMWNQIEDSYNEKFPDVDVNIRKIPWDNREQKILTGVSGGGGPDVLYALSSNMQKYVQKDMVAPIDEYIDDMDMEDFEDTAINPAKFDGKQYGLPILREAYSYFYNADLIEDIGKDPDNLPETWEEFDEWAKAAKQDDIPIEYYAGGQSLNSTFYPLVWQSGGEIVDKDGNIEINNDKSLEAWKELNKRYEEGWLPENAINANEGRNSVQKGEVVAKTGSSNLLQRMKNSDINWEMGPPLKHDGDPVTSGTVGMLTVVNTSENKEAAAEFVKNMVNKENMKSFNDVTNYIPPRKSAKSMYEDDEYLSQMSSYTKYARPGVSHPANAKIMEKTRSEVQAMMQGKKTPKEAADEAAKKIEKVMEVESE